MPSSRFAAGLVFVLLVTGLPILPVAAAAETTAVSLTAGPQMRSISEGPQDPPAPDRQQPSLTLTLTGQRSVATGGQLAFTLTVANQGRDPARDVVVTLPAPAGTKPRPGNGVEQRGWRWQLGELPAGASRALTGELTVESAPEHGAVVLRAKAGASGLAEIVATWGALVEQPATSATAAAGEEATGRFEPGTAVEVTSSDGQLTVSVPEDAATQPLLLTERPATEAESGALPALPFGRPGFGAVVLSAATDADVQVRDLDSSVRVAVRYTDDQLDALGIAPADLTLFRFDESTQDWLPAPTVVDQDAQVATATLSQLGTLQAGDSMSPSSAYLPSLQGFQTDTYTGSASFAVPIEVPDGPGGSKPDLKLSYSSAATDGPGGMRTKSQAGLVGKGWSLDTGSVALNKIAINDDGRNFLYFALTFDGRSFDAVPAGPAPGITNPNPNNPWEWLWKTTDESHLRIRAVVDNQLPGRGGTVNGQARFARYYWEVTNTSGVRFEFREDLWWGFFQCDEARQELLMEPYKWQLSKVTDTHGNVTNYRYGRQTQTGSSTCDRNHVGTLAGTVDLDAWPTEISWGGNPSQNAPERYKVTFAVSPRGVDTVYDTEAGTHFLGGNGVLRQTKQLDNIEVWANTGSWQRVRRYALRYEDAAHSMLSDARKKNPDGTFTGEPGFPKLTLRSVTRIGADNTTALPETRFTYGTDGGTGLFATGGWNRLVRVDNGQGGTMSVNYAPIGGFNGWTFNNRPRVVSQTQNDGIGGSYTWNYTYVSPNMNALGTSSDEWQGTMPAGNSAALYYAKYVDFRRATYERLAHQPNTEFRGHSQVTVVGSDGARTDHYYYQGDAGCTPTAKKSHDTIVADPCFQQLREREMLKGKEYLTQVSNPPAQGGKLASEVRHTFDTVFDPSGYGREPLSGLWRAFEYETEKTERAFDNTGAAQAKTTRSFLNRECVAHDSTTPHTNDSFGNILCVQELDQAGAEVRRKLSWFAPRDDGTAYIVDKSFGEGVFSGDSLVQLTISFYDNVTTLDAPPIKGDVLRTTNFYDLDRNPHNPNLTNVTVNGQDTTFGYDGFGNKIRTTTFDGPGQRRNVNGAVSYSAPGNASPAHDTLTTYDPTMHVYWVDITDPLSHHQKAEYDLVKGVTTKSIGPNGEQTVATHDAFGRTINVKKPGDIDFYPTTWFSYKDTAPVTVMTSQLGQPGVNDYHQSYKYYDGLGRVIQTKAESKEQNQPGGQYVLTDLRYDGHGRLVAKSQPRYVDQADGGFLPYINPGGTLYRQTLTSYDALDRELDVTQPDGSVSRKRYTVGAGIVTSISDENRHVVQQTSDTLGRLTAVRELSGVDGVGGVSATAAYTYDALDRLTGVRDAQGNVTSTRYDSLGRKTSMTDPDAGTIDYSYDVNGNLKSQTDARRQAVWFDYDVLNRLTAKRAGSATGPVLASFGYDAGTNGILQRTSMTSFAAGSQTRTTFAYDQRGRPTLSTQQTTGGPELSLTNSYDSADRTVSVRYQSKTGTVVSNDETVSYGYDASGRPVSLRTNLPGVAGNSYVKNITYTALDQPADQTMGNDVKQSWQYDAARARPTGTQLGKTGASPFLNFGYTYDPVGNLTGWTRSGNNQAFSYDDRDRLTCTKVNGSASCTESTRYDNLGRITAKDSTTYSYPAAGSPQPEHAPASTATAGQTAVQRFYDGAGNLVDTLQGIAAASTGRRYTYNELNQLSQVDNRNGTTYTQVERYTYDADGKRASRTSAGATTVYFGGLWQHTINGASRKLYLFNGKMIAQRDNNTTVTFLHGDQLGSITATTNSDGVSTATTLYGAWGNTRLGGTPATTLNFTGQEKDASGLLYYQSRYYDPAVGQFISADPVVPGTASGGMDSTAARPLTTSFLETGLVKRLGAENRGEIKQDKLYDGGPADPQALNRYAYVRNNPLKYTDPTGHTWYLDQAQTNALLLGLSDLALELGGLATLEGLGREAAERAYIRAGRKVISEETVKKAIGGALGKSAARFITGLATLYFALDAGVRAIFALKLSWFINLIRQHNTTAAGVAIGIEEDGSVTILDRGTGRATRWSAPWWDPVDRKIIDSLPSSMRVGGEPVGDPNWYKNYHFSQDEKWLPAPANDGPVQP